ncbi:MAG TPA: efflux RND transporter periplasmic adaptor subunit [Thermoanaerobaculia bacterium]|nr:efflux RND transporter periplasmic adaptor subunit [Thermoanaerobaculia bacterium]
MKKLIWIALALAIAAGVFVVLRHGRKIEPRYRTAAVDKGGVTQTVAATGTLSAVITVKVGSVVSGNVAVLHADFNKQVKKGDLLAELDPVPFQEKVDQAKAALDKAKVDVRNNEIGLRRQKALFAEQLAAQADLDQAEANYDSSVAAVAQAQANLQQTLTDLRNSKIVAPIDGVVVDREYDVGQSVAASFTAPTIFTIAQDLTKMQVSADVSESDIGMCKVGQPVRFTVDAYPDQVFHGTISQIRLNATVNQNVVTYPVIINVPNPDLALRPAMTANVTIDVASVKDVLRVPNAALRFRPEEKEGAASSASRRTPSPSAPQGAGASPEERAARSTGDRGPAGAMTQFDRTSGVGKVRKAGQTVYSLGTTGEPKAVEVRTGITDGRFTEIVSGDLKEGDAVIVGLATTKADAGSRVPGAPAAPGGRRF